jgi:hypothetical protein
MECQHAGLKQLWETVPVRLRSTKPLLLEAVFYLYMFVFQEVQKD